MRTFKILDLAQANFLIKNGCEVLSVSLDRITKRTYVKFNSNDTFNKYMKIWQKQAEQIRNSR